MVMLIILIILFLAVLAVWLGKRKIAIYLYTLSFVISIGAFIHHMSDVIGLSL